MVKMKETLKGIIPYGLFLLINYYALPLLIQDTGTAMLLLVAIIPISIGVCSIIYGAKHGFHFLYIGIATLLFVPSIFIFYNSSAWAYVFFYGAIVLAGNGIGCIFTKRRV
jgi:hypothetical protein